MSELKGMYVNMYRSGVPMDNLVCFEEKCKELFLAKTIWLSKKAWKRFGKPTMISVRVEPERY